MLKARSRSLVPLCAVVALAWGAPVFGDPLLLAEKAQLTAADATPGSRFGYAAIDGDTAVVTALDANNSSETYVFVRNGTSWSQQQKITGYSVGTYGFGGTAAVSGDTLVIGTGDANDSAAWVYVRSGTTWSLQQKLTNDDFPSNFGEAVAIEGDTIVIGESSHFTNEIIESGAAYVFERTGTHWTETQELTAADVSIDSQFGFSLGLHGDSLVIGAPGDSTFGFFAGSAYVFGRTAAGWSQQAKLIPDDPRPQASFGFAVGISGERAVVNAAGYPSAVYLFQENGSNWSQQQKLSPSYGNAFSAVAIQGSTVVVGSPYSDTAFTFVETGTGWIEQQELNARDGSPFEFGATVAISGDTVLIGSPGDNNFAGAAYVFGPDAPPDCSQAQADTPTLWPPDHHLASIFIQNLTDPDGDFVSPQIDQIFQDEPTLGPGLFCPAAEGIGGGVAQVRAERSSSGDGRVYTITFTAKDGKGGSCKGAVKVCVPLNPGRGCGDSGPRFDSTLCTSGSGHPG